MKGLTQPANPDSADRLLVAFYVAISIALVLPLATG